MKIKLILAGLFAASALQAATLIQYSFDQQIDTLNYADESGNERSVTFNRPVTYSSMYPFAQTHPEFTGFDYSGKTKVHNATAGAISNFSAIDLNVTKQFTMEGWVYVEDFAFYSNTVGVEPTYHPGILWKLGSSVGGTSTFVLQYTAEGVVQGLYNSRSQTGGTRTIDTGFTLEFNTWTHLAYVKTKNSVDIYINGELVKSLKESGITDRALPTSLTSATVAYDIYGQFDDFRLSDTALTQDQLGYHAPFSIPEPSTVALTFLSAVGGLLFLAKRGRHAGGFSA